MSPGWMTWENVAFCPRRAETAVQDNAGPSLSLYHPYFPYSPRLSLLLVRLPFLSAPSPIRLFCPSIVPYLDARWRLGPEGLCFVLLLVSDSAGGHLPVHTGRELDETESEPIPWPRRIHLFPFRPRIRLVRPARLSEIVGVEYPCV